MCDKTRSVCPCSSYEPYEGTEFARPDNCSKWLCNQGACPHEDELKAEADMDSLKFQEYVEQDLKDNPAYCPACGSCGFDGCCSPTKCDSVQCLFGEGNIRDYTCTGVQAWASMELLKQIHALIASGMSTDTVCDNVHARLTKVLPLLDELYLGNHTDTKIVDIINQIEVVVGNSSKEAQAFNSYVLDQLKR
jgi:hypothetical protein